MKQNIKSYKSNELTKEQINELFNGTENFILDGVRIDMESNRKIHELMKSFK